MGGVVFLACYSTRPSSRLWELLAPQGSPLPGGVGCTLGSHSATPVPGACAGSGAPLRTAPLSCSAPERQLVLNPEGPALGSSFLRRRPQCSGLNSRRVTGLIFVSLLPGITVLHGFLTSESSYFLYFVQFSFCSHREVNSRSCYYLMAGSRSLTMGLQP